MPEIMPCAIHTEPGTRVGQACLVCGHVNVLHPGPHNPDLQWCVICELMNRLGQVSLVLGSQTREYLDRGRVG